LSVFSGKQRDSFGQMHPLHVCQMCANSAKISYIRLCITEVATFTTC
jgi:hypothetical protein